MKRLGFFNKIIFFINSFFAMFLLVGYLLPLMPPSFFPALAVLTLVIPLLIAINLVFFIYWAVQLRRHLFLSAFVLVIGMLWNVKLYNFGETKAPTDATDDIRIMSYNIKGFNHFGSRKDNDIPDKILNLINSEDPDILCLQEYHTKTEIPNNIYPYRFKKVDLKRQWIGQIVYSKFEIVGEGSLDFPDSGNNGIYVDVVKNKDTLRIYNLHMQSFSIEPELDALQKRDKKKLLGRMGDAFKKQEEQTEIFLAHQKDCPYKMVVVGDFNNTVFSYAYNKIRGEKQDAFEEAGSGFGRTFIFDFIPLRIDFILPDNGFTVSGFKNYSVRYSDHYPIMASLRVKD